MYRVKTANSHKFWVKTDSSHIHKFRSFNQNRTDNRSASSSATSQIQSKQICDSGDHRSSSSSFIKTDLPLTIRFILLQNRQGKTRLAKYYIPLEESEKHKVEYEVHRLVVNGDPKFTNFVELRTVKAEYCF
ncbi:putative adaptor protein complex, sigma subunit [Helianthus annuus]|nr:putative adaptor protein complex, sigma subunit [Helianthus annuus]